ncbi:hypothetical protein CASFOL_036827 [Castilleja foliolosa]|uniref:S-protein homolog n=1 Tax=Castilleja foliolosa TaxID=1961234 RepID=A0ABD3BPS1_9LAMI
MFIKTTIIYFVLFFFLFTIIFHVTDGCFIVSKIRVQFDNRLPANIPKPLVVHCQTEEDDLGNHTLTPGQRWGFDLCEKPFTTKVTCELHWNGLYRNHIIAFNAKWFNSPCSGAVHCVWTVNAKGATLPHGEFHYWENLPPPNFNSIPKI